MVTPGPLLLPRRDMVFCYVHKSSLGCMVVPAKEIALAARNHVARRHRDVRIPAKVVRRNRAIRPEHRRLLLFTYTASAALPVIHAVVLAVAQRKCSRGTLRMVRNVAN